MWRRRLVVDGWQNKECAQIWYKEAIIALYSVQGANWILPCEAFINRSAIHPAYYEIVQATGYIPEAPGKDPCENLPRADGLTVLGTPPARQAYRVLTNVKQPSFERVPGNGNTKTLDFVRVHMG